MISMDSDHQSYIHWAIDFKMPAIWSEKPNLPFVQYSPWNLKPRIIDYVMHDCTSCICCELHLIIIAISAPFIGWYTLSCHLMVYTVLSFDGIHCLVIGWYTLSCHWMVWHVYCYSIVLTAKTTSTHTLGLFSMQLSATWDFNTVHE